MADPKSGAIFVLPSTTSGQQGPVASWVSTAGWARAAPPRARRRLDRHSRRARRSRRGPTPGVPSSAVDRRPRPRGGGACRPRPRSRPRTSGSGGERGTSPSIPEVRGVIATSGSCGSAMTSSRWPGCSWRASSRCRASCSFRRRSCGSRPNGRCGAPDGRRGSSGSARRPRCVPQISWRVAVTSWPSKFIGSASGTNGSSSRPTGVDLTLFAAETGPESNSRGARAARFVSSSDGSAASVGSTPSSKRSMPWRASTTPRCSWSATVPSGLGSAGWRATAASPPNSPARSPMPTFPTTSRPWMWRWCSHPQGRCSTTRRSSSRSTWPPGCPWSRLGWPSWPTVSTDDVDAVLVPAGDAQALANSLQQLHDDFALRERLGKAARAAAEARWSWDHEVRRILASLG